MTVYIDNMNFPYGRMIMCHMISDSLEELHSMADKIGINRRWFQDKENHPHYDISLSKKKLAIGCGAIEINSKELVRILKENYG